MRAKPFSAIFAHCQLTFSRNGVRKLGVVHTRFTSRPGAPALSGLHSQTRPSSSVTWRDDIVVLLVSGRTATQEMDCATGTEVTDPSESCERNCWPPVSLVTH
jgi:hypothetical protein